MSLLTLDDRSIFYELDGQEGAEPVVLISGFSADHTSWSALIPVLHEQGRLSQQLFQTVTIDNRGVGQSTWNARPFSISDMAQDVIRVCQALSLEKVHLVGSSMGGFIVQEVARLSPDLVKSLVIVNSSTKINTNYLVYVQGEIELREYFEDKIPPEILLKLGAGWVFGHDFLSTPGVVADLARLSVEQPVHFPIEIEKNQLEILKHFDSTPWLSTIEQPALVTGSNHDLIFLESDTRRLADLLPHAHYVYFENVGHIPQQESAHELAHQMLKFYERPNSA